MSYSMDQAQQLQAATAAFMAILEPTRVFTSVVLGVYVWEMLCTFPSEYAMIWSKKWSPITVVYLVTRYFTIVTLVVPLYLMYWPHSSEACSNIVRMMGIAPAFVSTAASIIMIARIYAVYEKSRPILVLCILLALPQPIAQIWLPARVSPPNVVPPPGVSACIPLIASDSQYWLYSTVVVFFDVSALLLIGFKTLTTWKNGKSTLVKVLIQDQILFFCLNSAAQLANMIFYLTSPPTRNGSLLAPLSTAITAISACRILLHLRIVADDLHTARGTSAGSFGIGNKSFVDTVYVTPGVPRGFGGQSSDTRRTSPKLRQPSSTPELVFLSDKDTPEVRFRCFDDAV